MLPTVVSGTCAREEGLRTLTSPRREASLFKLGRNQLVPAFSLVQTGSGVPPGSQRASIRLVHGLTRAASAQWRIAALQSRIGDIGICRPEAGRVGRRDVAHDVGERGDGLLGQAAG